MTENTGPRRERIAKYLARAGVASRRGVERLIAEGRVEVDGKVLETPATLVTGAERILVNGAPVARPGPARLWRYHKPKGLLTTHSDPRGRPTVFAALPAELGRVIAVGRLDLTSEGLLLLTNSGELARWMELPSTGWTRRYRVRAHGRADPKRLESLARGITLDGIRYGPIEATVERVQGANLWLAVSLREGKNREVRRVLAHLGLDVNRLIRISFGPFQLGGLKKGDVKPVPKQVLRQQMGAALAAIEAGAGGG